MKFPLPRNPFPPLDLSPEYLHQIQLLTQALLDQTVAEYEQHVHVNNRVVDKTKWKHIKTRENLHVYRAVGDHSDDHHMMVAEQLMDASSSNAMPTSRMNVKGGNRLMGVGTVVGNLPDLLYCCVSRTEDEMQIRTSYVPDECVDWRVLYTLPRGATEDNPFQNHTIKYHVKAAPGASSMFVRPRDFILLDCVGEMNLASGERVAYCIYHSVDVPGCGAVDGLVRGQFSCTYILRSLPGNSVEVYMRCISELGGNINDTIAAISIANAVISIWKMPWGGQNKKLAWMLKQRKKGAKQGAKTEKTDRCPLCTKSFSIVRSSATCELCRDQVCSSCITTRKISYVRPARELMQIPTDFCKSCITQCSLLDANEVARQEFIPANRTVSSSISSSTVGRESGQSNRPYTHSSTESEGWGVTPVSRVDLDSVRIETVNEWEKTPANPHGSVYSSQSSMDGSALSHPSPSVGDPHKMQLLIQMNQLRLAAEQTYQITKDNERAIQSSVHSTD
ncbi:hypothetical protein Poli38472_001959 [Pythium oligandrum]|uniref:FYVE-type domain-containing protein n=1 Tax=Pythium oligandrum TaxID=41045 RepID=A0A8K1CX14_PYTOL|nr:hypothetical protein Poli38472_001959 [Pythium oligandrum]|eukprot:TMW69803.1 hypothetical protein Poli38472_001959 [Pythium oligandrum]